jgi:hypothetical protein
VSAQEAVLNPISELRGLFPESVFVEHEPRTEAYWRAETALSGILAEGSVIGFGLDHQCDQPRRIIIVWVEPLNSGEFGEYAAFKILEDEFGPYRAILFSFYDGLDGRPGFKSESEATDYMKEKFPDYARIFER